MEETLTIPCAPESSVLRARPAEHSVSVRRVRPVGDWKADDSSLCCEECGEAFTFLRRRHHCRRCGCLFCSKCSSQTAVVPGKGPGKVRVCDLCKEACSSDSFGRLRGSASSLPSIRTSASFEHTPGPTPPLSLTPSPQAETSRSDMSSSAFKKVPDRAGSVPMSRSVERLRCCSTDNVFGTEYTRKRALASSPPLEVRGRSHSFTPMPVHFTSARPRSLQAGGDSLREIVVSRGSTRDNLGLSLAAGTVTAVDYGSPAQRAGIEVGMRVETVERHSVRTDFDASEVVRRFGGREIRVVVRGAEDTLRVPCPRRVCPADDPRLR
eukprot:TRINITY_DN2958_c0_g4_i1.p1 TRINITY_DN2958_c0_g4~~TRINITY_DN2958_c0_g4_i1.p1  ORF type:complete len:324 (+),score=84.35 TRINITY_DN2958_c0_g4_i1:275-1246(+)